MNENYISYEDFERANDNNDFEQLCPANSTKAEMLSKIKDLQFSIIELGQYLDTHPEDTKALMMHKNYSNKYKIITEQYQRKYGPLTIMCPCNKWRWIEMPWPWERSDF